MRNIRTIRPSKKLDSKWEGPFKVIKRVSEVNFGLDLPKSMGQHRVFHTSLLTKDPNDPLPGQAHPEPEPVRVEDREKEFEVEELLEVKKKGRGLMARADWVGYDKDPT